MNVSFALPRTAALVVALALAAAGLVTLASTAAAQDGENVPYLALRGVFAGGAEIGVTVRDLTDADLRGDEVTSLSGAYVEDVRQDSPAADAGFEAGDIFLDFDGEHIRGARQLARLVRETPGGREVEATVQRAGTRVTLTVAPESSRIADFTSGGRLAAPNVHLDPRGPLARLNSYIDVRRFNVPVPAPPGLRPGAARLGVTVQALTDQLGEYFGASNGVLVTSAISGGPAGVGGMKAGDVITKIDDATVGSVADLRQRVAQATGLVTVTVVRDRTEQTFTVRLGNERPTARMPL